MTITVSSWFLNKFMLVDQLCSPALLNQAANWLWHPAKMFQPHAPHAPAQKSLPATESWHFTSFELASQAQFHFMDRARVACTYILNKVTARHTKLASFPKICKPRGFGFGVGRVRLPNRMNFRKNSKRPLAPPPHFRKIMLQFVYNGFGRIYMQEGTRAR